MRQQASSPEFVIAVRGFPKLASSRRYIKNPDVQIVEALRPNA